MYMDAIIGHTHLLSYFRHAKERGVLGHAYMLVGPRHVGKQTLAEIVSAEILGVSKDALYRHPDVITVTRGVHEKTGKTKKFIDTDEIRELTSRLHEASFLGGHTIAIVDGAEDMNQGAANAFLKTLEEPGQKTLLWLLVEDVSRVPATIRSRCQVFSMAPVPEDVLAEGLVKEGESPPRAKQLARESLGRPGRAILSQREEETAEAWAKEAARFVSLFGTSFHEKIKAVEDLLEDTDDATGNREALKDTLAIWQLALGDMARATQGKPCRLIRTVPSTNLLSSQGQHIEKRIADADNWLSANGHPRLLIEHILLAIP